MLPSFHDLEYCLERASFQLLDLFPVHKKKLGQSNLLIMKLRIENTVSSKVMLEYIATGNNFFENIASTNSAASCFIQLCSEAFIFLEVNHFLNHRWRWFLLFVFVVAAVFWGEKSLQIWNTALINIKLQELEPQKCIYELNRKQLKFYLQNDC